jgi:hypothetical protein
MNPIVKRQAIDVASKHFFRGGDAQPPDHMLADCFALSRTKSLNSQPTNPGN